MRRRTLLGGLAGTGFVIACGSAAQPAERVVPVVARRFVFLPAEITLQLGEPVVIELTAPEVVMGFHVPDLNLRAVIVPGTPVRLRFLPERAGRFVFVCDVFCGDGHENMAGEIIVRA